MLGFLTRLKRRNKQILIILFDVFAIIGCLFTAFYIRLGSFNFLKDDNLVLVAIFLSPLLAIPIFSRFGLYLDVIRYIGLKSLWQILKAISLYAASLGLIYFMIRLDNFPRSVVIINWLLLLIIVGSSRLFARWFLSEINSKRNVLIYGAGSAGRQLSRALNESNEYKVYGFIDDSKEIYNHSIAGLTVYSQDDLHRLVTKFNIKEILLAIPSISRSRRKEIINLLEPFSISVRSLPGVDDLALGKVKVNDLLEVDLEDLLGRDEVDNNHGLLEKNIKNKNVLISGAGGSIGSELSRQVCLIKPKNIVLYEISEASLYLINQELINLNLQEVNVVPIIGSIRDKNRLIKIIKYYSIQTIYHAAAYKHVPLVEFNQSQGILNNSIGTKIIAEAAIETKVKNFVLISTDKAVRPTNVMGASKRISELVLQAFAELKHSTCFTIVRFGNVLDSSGSVIPLFKKQINDGGPVTVTDYNVVRYFMTIPEAVQLVIQSGVMSTGGEVFILDMGKPVRIDDLAKKMIKLSGLEVKDDNNLDGDIEIKYIGLRPGEKLYEELLIGDSLTLTENKLIRKAEEEMIEWSKLKPMIEKIEKAAIESKTDEIYELLKEIVPGFNPQSS